MLKTDFRRLNFRKLLKIVLFMTTFHRFIDAVFSRNVHLKVVAFGRSSSNIVPKATLTGHTHRRKPSYPKFSTSSTDHTPHITNSISKQPPGSSLLSAETDDAGIRRHNERLGETSSPSKKNYDLYRPYFPIYYNDVYEVDLPPGHRFPMGKYRKVRQIVQEKVSTFSDRERQLVQSEFRVSPLASVADLSSTHCPSYIDRFLKGNQSNRELRNVGFPWSQQGVNRALSSVGGTVAAATAICDLRRLQILDNINDTEHQDDSTTTHKQPPGQIWAAHLAGGTHHAFHSRGEGFCIFSDIAVAANVLLLHYPDLIRNILIIDLDVHQGNGNAVLFEGREEVFTFSIQCEENHFSKKETVGDLDIDLPAGCNDATYLATLNHWLKRIANEKKREQRQPFDFIFYQAGVDILESDRLGRMTLTREGVRRRNDMVFQFATAMEVPLCITMGGGYPRDTNDWTPILDAHADVYLQALQFLGRRKE